MICRGYECLIDPQECPPSISVLLSLPFSPQEALSPPRSQLPPPGSGQSAELEDKTGAPNLSDWAFEEKRRCTMLFYRVCFH